MKLIFFIATATLLVFCKNNKNVANIEKGNEATSTSVTEMAEAARHAGDTDRKKETSRKLQPLTDKELSALLPDAVGGFKLPYSTRSEAFEEGAIILFPLGGYAEYIRSDGAKIHVKFLDCGGFGHRCDLSIFEYDFDWLQDVGGEVKLRTIDFMGDKALVCTSQGELKETADPEEPEFRVGLLYIASGRLAVGLECNREDIDLLKDFAKKLNLKN